MICDVCKTLMLDTKQVNGPNHRVIKRQLFTVWSTHYALATFCYVHDIQLFTLGEKEFFKRYPEFLSVLYNHSAAFKKSKGFSEN